MQTTIQVWGNSQGIRIPKPILKKSHFHVGDEISISILDDQIILKRVHNAHHRFNIHDLVGQIAGKQPCTEEDWGQPSGKEIW